jgi:hypothetical protein
MGRGLGSVPGSERGAGDKEVDGEGIGRGFFLCYVCMTTAMVDEQG